VPEERKYLEMLYKGFMPYEPSEIDHFGDINEMVGNNPRRRIFPYNPKYHCTFQAGRFVCRAVMPFPEN
jgi:hypothetical protein